MQHKDLIQNFKQILALTPQSFQLYGVNVQGLTRGKKMKKIIATILATAGVIASATPFVSAADNFSGAYAGLTAGFSSLKGKGSLATSAAVESTYAAGSNLGVEASNTGTFGQTGFNGGLLLGYGVLMDAFYVGGELSAIFNSNSDGTPWTLTNKGTSLGNATASTNVYNRAQYGSLTKTIDFKQKESFGLALRFGYLATQKAMMYLSLGLNYSRFSLTETLNYAVTGDITPGSGTVTVGATTDETPVVTGPKSARSLSFTPGIGTEIMLSNNLAFRSDFSYEMGKALFATFDTTNIPGGIKATRASFRVGLSYHF